jgi:predicted TIM-barrel fold metal-dependent hydrolase
MKLETAEVGQGRRHGIEGLPIVDTDFHNSSGGAFTRYLPERWRHYLSTTGRRNLDHWGSTTQQRPLACRLDSVPPGGGPPGSDPDFAREQLLDEYDLAYSMINNIECLAGGSAPVEFEIAHCAAINDYNREVWLASDPRWVASICVPADHPRAAAEEIERCVAASDRFVQILVGSRNERPQGNPKYWPMYEAAVRHDLPVAFHVANSRYNPYTGVGSNDYYYEIHTQFPLTTQAMLASMVFEGLFDRFPDLKIVATELGWEWVVPFAWRLDTTWGVLKDETRLRRRPSDYLRENCWFTTQPCVETEDPADLYELHEQFESEGFGERLLFATDYPHWDMDSPFEALPPTLPEEVKERIFYRNAAALYGFEIEGVA